MSPPTLGVPNASVDKLLNTPYTRTLPIKRYDAEPLSRQHLQHNLLSHIFNDQTRCFTNPRPIQLASKVPNYQPSLLYPYGHSLNCSRRSDETQEEFDKWRSDYQDWNQKTQNGTKESNLNGDPTPGCKYLTFKELYIEAIVSSARCTKTMRDKLIADPEYAEDFAKVCLLVNVGKMNTTLAFYPEMKTILRSYHPLPSLQRNENTRKVMQDAPRMKTILKSAFLIHEEPPAVSSRITKNEVVDPSTKPATAKNDKTAKNRKAAVKNAEENNITLEDVPSNLDDIFEKFNRRNQSSSRDPVTSICTLLFVLSTAPEEITALHFDNEKKKNGKKMNGGGGGGEGNGKGKEVENEEEQDEFLVDEDEGLTKDQIDKEGEDFLSIFFPRKDSYLSSKSRAKSFLWLIWNYYEGFNRLPFLSRDLIQSNPFNDEHSLRSENYILNYFNQLNPVQKQDLIQKSNGRWKGIENPEGLIWLKASLPSPSSSSGNKSAATIAKEQQAAKLKTVSSLLTLIEKDGAPSILYDTAPKPKGGFPPPSLFKKRLLAPRFERISKEKWELENLDTEEELKWGKEMKEERGRFLIEFAGNEQKKALSLAEANSGGGIEGEDREKRENSIQSTRSGLLPGGDGDEEDELMSERGTPAPPLGHAVKNSGSGSGKGKRKATDSINGESGGGGRVSKRIPQGNSSYPLANILAHANKTAQGIVGDPPSNSSPGPSSSKMEISQSKDGEGEEETTNIQEQIQLDQDGLMIPGKQYLINHENQISTLKNLWNSDLSYPKTLEILENQNFISSNPSTSTSTSDSEKKRLLHFDSDPRFNGSGERLLPSLPLQAWNRILNRAAKGVGDASYESDDEEVLLNDAVDELPRGELSRILRVLRCVRGVELGSEDASGGIKMEVD